LTEAVFDLNITTFEIQIKINYSWMEFFYMKIMNPIRLLITLLFLVFSHTVQAETKYVVEYIQVNARTGSSVEHKIVTMLESGQKVEALGVDKDWSHIQLADGKEGWILSRFLTSEEPKKLALNRLRAKYNDLNNQVDILLEETKLSKEENQVLKSELILKTEALDEITKNYENLKQGSSEFIQLKTNEQEAVLKLKELTSKAESLEKEVSISRHQQNIRWFLAGSGVLFLGFLVGSISKRNRRRSSLL
jgi:SH3 domain protein